MSQNNDIPIMTEKFKKIERQYVLSDSTVNEYGFRLLTSGYDLPAFQKNPIGYYMHRREDGIVLKWEDVHVADDAVVGTPVINLSHTRGEQTCNEAENGFLNAASVGHIVVLEYSTDPEMMLPGQTGPTITKWYNKECSLVDIPGNGNALTRLYDAQENELNLADLNITNHVLLAQQKDTLKELATMLQLADGHNHLAITTAVNDLALKTGALEVENKALKEQLDEIAGIRAQQEVTALLERGLEDRKLTAELRNKLAADYATNPDGLSALLAAMPAYRTITELLSSRQTDSSTQNWQWDDYEKNDPSGKKLKDLRANDPVLYRELFDKKFNS